MECMYCSANETFKAPSFALLNQHIRICHSNEPNFVLTCQVRTCERTFRHFRTYQNHLLRHRETISYPLQQTNTLEDNDETLQDNDEALEDNDEAMEIPTVENDINQTSAAVAGGESDILHCNFKENIAKWIIRTSETRSLSRATTLGIIEDVSGLIDDVVQQIQIEVNSVLCNHHVYPSQIEGLDSAFTGKYAKPFKGLTTFYQQLLGLIEPRRIVLDQCHIQKRCGSQRKLICKKEEVMYIPLLLSLEQMLQKTTFLQEVLHGHFELNPNILGDYCDGTVFKNHPLYSNDHTALQITLYYDELEVCNPLGSRRKKHKLGAFYFMLGNVHPKLRAKAGSIQLLALVKSSYVSKHGIDKILSAFVDAIKSLESDEGVNFTINGVIKNFRGTVSIVSADNPASQAIGGFKEGSMAFRNCRHCLGTDSEIQNEFTERSFKLRTVENHKYQCDKLESIGELSSHYSTVGINRRPLLNQLKYFKVAGGPLIPDIMHDILEGVLPMETKLMLKHFVIDMKLFSLQTLDEGFQIINLCFTDSDKPTPLSGLSLSSPESTLRQHAMQMWTLGRFLPLVIGQFIDAEDNHWCNFLRLLDIIDILFSK